MRTFSVLVLVAALFGSASAVSPRPAVKRFAQGAQPKTLLHAAAPAPAPADSLASTATLLTKGGVVALVPYILLALASPAAREALVSVLTGMSAQGIVETFATYMLADFLSNFLQHPTQKMDYGAANQLIGREVDSKWWGTRIEHIVGVAACLAVVDHFSQGFFGALSNPNPNPNPDPISNPNPVHFSQGFFGASPNPNPNQLSAPV